MLHGKKILLGITGSIAAYKAAVLCRLLIKNGNQVRVVMTPSACDFITPLTISTLTGHQVFSDISDGTTWNNHVELGMWADVMLIAPCTATTLSKAAHGIADNLLLACFLSAKCPVFIAPAMDLDMWRHPATHNSIELLTSYQIKVIPVDNGFLASGLYGDGRMAEPEDILRFLQQHFICEENLLGKNVLITAGPTYEALDPVRFIGNRSSGKMGYAIAAECSNRGANVTIVSGPVSIKSDNTNANIIYVQSAAEMLTEVEAIFDQFDIVVFAAAVADYTPAFVSDIKIKKNTDYFQIELKKTVDIAAHLGGKKAKNQLLVGFALETNDAIENAKRKLHTKNLDFIVLNALSDFGAGFQHETNKITILDSNENVNVYALKSKKEVAVDIVNYIVNFIDSKHE